MFFSGLSLMTPSLIHQDMKLEMALKRLLIVAWLSRRSCKDASQARIWKGFISVGDGLNPLVLQKEVKSARLY